MKEFELINHSIDADEIILIPISDVHLGSIGHRKDEWDAFCKYVKDTPNVYITLGGDLINNSIRSSVANPFDEIMRPSAQKRVMVEYLKPIKDRILCAVSGNHEARTLKDTDQDITYDIMAKLDLEDIYCEDVAFVKLSLGSRNHGKETMTSKVSFVLCVTHGSGGGIYTGATVNRNERFSNILEGVDIICVGHTHKGTVSKPTKIVVDSNHNKISVKTVNVVSSESWTSYGGYAARKMLLPSESANPQRIHLGGTHAKKKIEIRW